MEVSVIVTGLLEPAPCSKGNNVRKEPSNLGLRV